MEPRLLSIRRATWLDLCRTLPFNAVLFAVILSFSIGSSFAVNNATSSAPKPTLIPINATSAFTTSSPTKSPNVVKGAYFPPTDLRANITSGGTVYVTWKPPPREKSPPKQVFEIWLAYRNISKGHVSNFTKIASTSNLFAKYTPKDLVHNVVKNVKLEQKVGFLVFKVRTMSSNSKDKIKGKFCLPVEVMLLKPKPKMDEAPYLPPMNISANLTLNGTVCLSWNPPQNGKPPEKPLYDIQIAYGTTRSSAPSRFKDLERRTSTFIESDIGKLLLQFVNDDEDKLASYLLFRVRAIKMVTKKLVYGKFSVIIKVKIRMPQPRNFTSPQKPKTWIYIVAPLGGVVVALVIILGVYCHKQYRIRKSYMSYIRTQYDTESEALSVSNENFGLDSDNQPQIRFSDGEGDDESLIVA